MANASSPASLADEAAALRNVLGLPRVVRLAEVTSTLDVAHEIAAGGAAAGTLIVADTQTAGRGRLGRSWRSEPGAGVWLTLVERPADAAALEVLSLRIGLALAPALDAFADQRVALKWPNDLYVGDRKLAGVLIEARWRETAPEWVAIGVGINLRPPPSEARATGLRAGTSREAVLEAAVPAMRQAAAARGPLTAAELSAFAERDLAAGRRCIEPVAGTVQGIDASGALLVVAAAEADRAGVSNAPAVIALRAGSLVFEEMTR